jgi:hypothetical protein
MELKFTGMIALALLAFSLSLSDAPVPYVMRNTAPVKVAVVKKPRKLTDSECVSSAIYHEARGEPLEGQRAVYEVILHRANVLRMSLCGVVTAPKQFSWYGEPGKPILPFTKPMQDLLKRAKMHPRVLDGVEFRWFFSGQKIPKWAVNMDCRIIGGHRFCREKEQTREEDTTWKFKESTESGHES